MSYYTKEPNVDFKKVTFGESDYLYIKYEDYNIVDKEERISWIYIEVKNFYLKKDGRVLHIGNHLGIVYTLTAHTESMLNKWTDSLKKTIDFPCF